MSIGMRIHDKARRYSSAQSRKSKACRAGAHTAGTRNAGMGGAGAQNANMHSAQDHLDACGGWTRKGMSATVICCGPPSHRSGVQLVSATPRKMLPRPGAPRRVRTQPTANRTSAEPAFPRACPHDHGLLWGAAARFFVDVTRDTVLTNTVCFVCVREAS